MAGLSSFFFGGVNLCRGHQVVGGFGHSGQDSFRYPGDREPERMLLAGWEVSQFGQGMVKQQVGQGNRREDNKTSMGLSSDEGILIYVFKEYEVL
jgi:hypothetical protein